MKQHARSTVPVTIAVAVLALALGSVGTAVAGPALTESRVKAIAAKVVKKKGPKLTVAKANSVKDGAVTGASVADRSLGAADLAVGVVPADGYILEAMNVATDPVPSPDTPGVIAQPFTLPRAGTAHVRLFVARASADCSAGSGAGGLYIDGVPVPGTRRSLPAPGAETALELVGSAAVSAGPHQLRYGIDCPSGTNSGSAFINATWTVMLAAE
jgi:hypothetical protein